MTYFQYFLKRKTALILIVGASLMAGFGYTATQPFEYQSVVKLIVVHGNEQLDSYTASRAAERSAKTLSNVVGTTSFFENVLALDPSISDAFGANESDQRENWERSIEATVTPDTGVLTIAVYSKQPKIAEAIANASAKTISTQQWKYLGAGTSAVVEIIDAPLTSTHPVRPNILLNFISSLILGVMIAVVYVVLTTSEHVLSATVPAKHKEQRLETIKEKVEPRSQVPTHVKVIPQEQSVSTPLLPEMQVFPIAVPESGERERGLASSFEPMVSDLPIPSAVVSGDSSRVPAETFSEEEENRLVVDGKPDHGLQLERDDFFTMQDHLKRLREQQARKSEV